MIEVVFFDEQNSFLSEAGGKIFRAAEYVRVGVGGNAPQRGGVPTANCIHIFPFVCFFMCARL